MASFFLLTPSGIEALQTPYSVNGRSKQQKNQLDKKESWNPKTEPMGVETAEYYSVSDVYYIGEGETCFLAINKNVTPNYGALLCVVSNVGAEKEYSLFD